MNFRRKAGKTVKLRVTYIPDHFPLTEEIKRKLMAYDTVLIPYLHLRAYDTVLIPYLHFDTNFYIDNILT